jgi:putative endonuclease
MSSGHRFGRRAESLVADHLRACGWRILERNWRFRHKEVDLVVERDGVVAFVEVKGRRAGAVVHPLEAITPTKRRDLALAARGWVAKRGRPGVSYRFDAATVVKDGTRVTVEYTEDAWRL